MARGLAVAQITSAALRLAAPVAGMVLYGGAATLTGAALPVMLAQYRWSPLEAGTLLAAGHLGALSTIAAGPAVDRWGSRPVLLLGVLLVGLCTALFGLVPWYLAALALWLLGGIGFGLMEVGLNALTVSLTPEDVGGGALNLVHTFFGLGAVLGPALVAGVLAMAWPYQVAYRVAALGALAVAIVVYRTAERGRPARSGQARAGPAGAAPMGALALLSVLMFLYVALELGMAGWAAVYASQVRGASAPVAAAAVSALYGGLAVGRLLCAGLAKVVPPALMVVLLAVGAVLGMWWTLDGPGSVLLPLAFLGLSFSGVYPLAMALGSRAWPGHLGVVTGLLATAAIGGALVVPWFMSLVVDRAGIVVGMRLYLWVALLHLLAALGTLRAALSPAISPGAAPRVAGTAPPRGHQ